MILLIKSIVCVLVQAVDNSRSNYLTLVYNPTANKAF